MPIDSARGPASANAAVPRPCPPLEDTPRAPHAWDLIGTHTRPSPLAHTRLSLDTTTSLGRPTPRGQTTHYTQPHLITGG